MWRRIDHHHRRGSKISEVAAKALVASPAVDAIITLHGLAAKLSAPSTLIEQLSLQLSLAHYQYSQTLNQRKTDEGAQTRDTCGGRDL